MLPADPLIEKLGEYVASYGAKASVFVGVETYTQSVTMPDSEPSRPRRLVAEFAIVKAAGGWTGFRDVVQLNNEELTDRRDRLLRLLTGSSAHGPTLMRLANESARYNIGPIVRNLNLPTTALFFFQPADLDRFTFSRKGTKKIDGTETVEFEFRETRSPTMVMTLAGKDVPVQGTLWIANDGAVVRTRLRMKNFGDTVTSPVQQAPSQRPAVDPTRPTGGRDALGQSGSVSAVDLREIETFAEIQVTYSRHRELDVWLPSKMSEQYVGPIKLGTRPPLPGTSRTSASYSNYKQFGTGARIKIEKQVP